MAGERIPFQPERNYIPPVERGGFVLPVTTEPRSPTTTRTREAPPSPRKKSSEGYETAVKEVFDRLAPPPTEEQTRAANALEYAGSTRTVERYGGNRLLKLGFATTI